MRNSNRLTPLYTEPMPKGGPRQQAWNCLRSLGFRKAISGDKVHLRFAGIDEYVGVIEDKSGKRAVTIIKVKFKQVAKIEGRTRPVWYLADTAAVEVHMDENGVVYKIDATLASGARPRTLQGTISDKKAVEITREAFGSKCEQRGKVRLRFINYGNHSHLVRIVKLSDARLRNNHDTECPADLNPRTVIYVVDAKTGEVLEQHQTLRYLKPVGPDGRLDKESANKEKLFRATLNKENYKHLLTLAQMDNQGNLILENDTCKVRYNKADTNPNPSSSKVKKVQSDEPNWTTKVEPLANGTFSYKPGQDEFDAIITFLAINFQFEYLKQRGLKTPEKPFVWSLDNYTVPPYPESISKITKPESHWSITKLLQFEG